MADGWLRSTVIDDVTSAPPDGYILPPVELGSVVLGGRSI